MRSLRVKAREFSLSELEDALAKLTGVVYEHRAEQQAKDTAEKERLEKILAFAEKLADKGIKIEVLISIQQNKSFLSTKKRKSRPAKYQWGEDGVLTTWTGQGRMPNGLKNLSDDELNRDKSEI